MKKTFLPFLLAILFISNIKVFAQQPNKVTISATVQDTGKVAIAFATVMLLNPKDSTLTNFTTTNIAGEFTFNSVKNMPYLLKISHVNSLPFQKYITENNDATNNLGTLMLTPLNRALVEFVIKAAKAPLYIRGDTIEYDATTFKVPPGSTVEDLLRRLPGIQVDASGNISAQGKNIRRVYVDGKSFFGDDPKNVTKNLDAEAISKVQVFTEKSEQTKLTGVDDGSQEKAMNLELKDEFKKGTFGKVTMAGGTEERWASRGNFNKFNEKHQLSFIAYANNINETDVNWDDYSEFKGSNAFNNNDNGDFGFNNNRNYYYYSSGGEDYNYFNGQGFTKNFGAGSNYNYDTKKLKFNLSYFYNQTDHNYDETSYQATYLADSTYINNDTLTYKDFYGKHSASTRIEWNIDSNNVFIAKANSVFYTKNIFDQNFQHFSNQNLENISYLASSSTNDLSKYNVNSTAIFRHKFKKEGRSLALSGSFNKTNKNISDKNISINEFFKASSLKRQINLLNGDTQNSVSYKANALFTTKLPKHFFSETFYNFSVASGNNDYRTLDQISNFQKVDSLTYYAENNYFFNRIGSSIRYSNKGLNATIGLAAQQINNKYSFYKNQNGSLIIAPIDKMYQHLLPNININYQLPKNTHLSINYSYNVQAPSQSDLLPTPIVTSILYKKEGNPNLKPELSHDISLNLNKWNPASFSSVGVHSSYSRNEENIVYNQTIKNIDSIGLVTTIVPMNYKGGQSGYFYLWTNFPIVKTKLTMNLNASSSASERPEFINNALNTTTNLSYSFSSYLNFTPTQKLVFGLQGSISDNYSKFSINTEQNQKRSTLGCSSSIKWQFLKKFFFESNFDFTNYQNDKIAIDQKIPLWNASLRRQLGKKNRVEIRLAVFDIFNKNVVFDQNFYGNHFTITKSPTLARYFMLSFSYNIKGFSDKLKEN